MDRLFLLPESFERDPAIGAWMTNHRDEFGAVARYWFGVLRGCGDDVREVLHDGNPTACVGDAAFAYVGAFTSHVSVGFFRGAALPDPQGLLEGGGRYMRHVKIRPGRDVDSAALLELIRAAYADVRARVERTATEED